MGKKNGLGIKNFVAVFFVIVLLIGGYYIYTQRRQPKNKTSVYEQFSILSNYLKGNGYDCAGNLMEPGSSCNKETKVNKYNFIRYDDGIQYITESANYKVNLLYRQNSNEISISLNNGAFEGYKDKKYYCETHNDTILGQLENCRTLEKEELDNQVYINVIRTSLKEINDILEHSGYNSSKLVSLYKWTK